MRFLRIRDRLRRRIPPHWLLIAAAALVGLALLVSAGIMRAPHNPLTDALVSAMQSGRITGHSEDGTFYSMQVRRAVLHEDNAHYHYLTEPRATWAFQRTDAEPLEFRLRAPVGELDSKAQILLLPQAFEIRLADSNDSADADADADTDDGWLLRSARATILLRTTELTSDAPAQVTSARTTIRSERVELNHRDRQLIFQGHVESRWLPPDAPPDTPAAPATP